MWEFVVLLSVSNAITLYFYWTAKKAPLIHPTIRGMMSKIAKRFRVNDTPDEVFAQAVVITDALCNYIEQGCTIVARDVHGNEFPVPLSPDWTISSN